MKIELKDNTPEIIKDHLLDYFEVESLARVNKCFTRHFFDKTDEGHQLRSQLADTSHAWFMEDPYTKGLVKSVELDLEPEEAYNFIVVLKSEVVRKV